ncbi:MAG: nucleoside kinase [Tissierellia bacterium]|nr:nucleoside kinase [Tissierellia bacterium]
MNKRNVKVVFDVYEKKIEKYVDVKDSMTYEDLLKEYGGKIKSQVVLAKVQNRLVELFERIDPHAKEIVFLDTSDVDGNRVYMRSLSYLFITATNEILNDKSVVIEHTISEGLYCTIRQDGKIYNIDTNLKNAIKNKMLEFVRDKLKIEKLVFPVKEAIDLFKKQNRLDKIDLLKYRQKRYISIYRLGDYYDYFYGHMVPSTEYLKSFDIEIFDYGIVLLGVDPKDKYKVKNFVPHYLLSDTYNEAEAWSEMQEITSISKLNKIIEEGRIGDVCRMSEDLQQYKIMRIAQEIHSNNKRIILIAAPSSSGKTSFAYKLTSSLRVLGLKPISISLDDYYVNRVDTPLDENGNYDFEALESIDLDLFNKDLNDLMQAKPIERIRFDFLKGERVYTGEEIRLSGSDPVIIEGIHGLNPSLTRQIDERFKFRIYLSVITQINLDDHNRVATTDLRLLRRMARDKYFRGKDVRETILEWKRVRQGEEKYIFPYQEQADVMFNSSFTFDISALKPIVIDDIKAIAKKDPAYVEAARLKSFLQYFVSLEDTSDIVNTSILREFIGGSKII